MATYRELNRLPRGGSIVVPSLDGFSVVDFTRNIVQQAGHKLLTFRVTPTSDGQCSLEKIDNYTFLRELSAPLPFGTVINWLRALPYNDPVVLWGEQTKIEITEAMYRYMGRNRNTVFIYKGKVGGNGTMEVTKVLPATVSDSQMRKLWNKNHPFTRMSVGDVIVVPSLTGFDVVNFVQEEVYWTKGRKEVMFQVAHTEEGYQLTRILI